MGAVILALLAGAGAYADSAKTADPEITALYFFQQGCIYCARFEAGPLKDQTVLGELKTLNFVRVNISSNAPVDPGKGGKPQQQLAREQGVDIYPTLVFKTSEGNEIARIRGFFETRDFLEMLKYVTRKHYVEESFEKYLERLARGG